MGVTPQLTPAEILEISMQKLAGVRYALH